MKINDQQEELCLLPSSLGAAKVKQNTKEQMFKQVMTS
jgi:hypothetical protein